MEGSEEKETAMPDLMVSDHASGLATVRQDWTGLG
jgi:hypothetical protein